MIPIAREEQLAPCGARPALRWQTDPFYRDAPSETEVRLVLTFLKEFAEPHQVDTVEVTSLAERIVRWARWKQCRGGFSCSPGAVAVAALRVGIPVFQSEPGTCEVRVQVRLAPLPSSVWTWKPREDEAGEELTASELAHEARSVVGL
jgi:hypothetical protein